MNETRFHYKSQLQAIHSHYFPMNTHYADPLLQELPSGAHFLRQHQLFPSNEKSGQLWSECFDQVNLRARGTQFLLFPIQEAGFFLVLSGQEVNSYQILRLGQTDLSAEAIN